MLTIRLQRTGRSGHAQFRVVVQDSRFSPTSGRVVAYLGSYDPHSKKATIDSQKAASYLENGAQPSDSAARLLKKEGIKLPAWVKIAPNQKKTTRNPEKLRRNCPAEEKPAKEAPTEEAPVSEAEPTEAPANEAPADDTPSKEETTKAPAEADGPEAETDSTKPEAEEQESAKNEESEETTTDQPV